MGLPSGLSLPEKTVILLVENNHCFGLTGTTAAKEIKERFPSSTILYAADWMDYSYQKNDYADAIFFGKLNNDTKTLDAEEAAKKDLEVPSALFPWENEEEEWTTVEAKQFEYKDELLARKSSVFEAELKE